MRFICGFVFLTLASNVLAQVRVKENVKQHVLIKTEEGEGAQNNSPNRPQTVRHNKSDKVRRQ
jgi:hypothetical protein